MDPLDEILSFGAPEKPNLAEALKQIRDQKAEKKPKSKKWSSSTQSDSDSSAEGGLGCVATCLRITSVLYVLVKFAKHSTVDGHKRGRKRQRKRCDSERGSVATRLKQQAAALELSLDTHSSPQRHEDGYVFNLGIVYTCTTTM